jgi:glycerophosphoryl diester phosphodiesterase
MSTTRQAAVENDVNRVFVQSQTLKQVIHCLKIGVKGVSVSVQCNRDNIPFIFNDMKVNKKTQGNGFFCYHDNDDVAVLDVENESIPTFSSVLETLFDYKGTLPEGFNLIVNIRRVDSVDKVCDMILMEIESARLSASLFTISSNNMPLLKRVKTILPMIKRAATVQMVPADYATQFVTLGVDAVHVDDEFLDLNFLRDVLARGLKVRVFNTAPRSEESHLSALGCVDIITSNPEDAL